MWGKAELAFFFSLEQASFPNSVLSPLSCGTSLAKTMIKSVPLPTNFSISSTAVFLSLWLYGLS